MHHLLSTLTPHLTHQQLIRTCGSSFVVNFFLYVFARAFFFVVDSPSHHAAGAFAALLPSLRDPDAAQIRHDIVLLAHHRTSEGRLATAATQSVGYTSTHVMRQRGSAAPAPRGRVRPALDQQAADVHVTERRGSVERGPARTVIVTG